MPSVNNNLCSFCFPLTRETLPIILGVTLAVGGLFLILSKSVTIPQKINTAHPRMGNYLVGGLLIGGGILTTVLAALHFHKRIGIDASLHGQERKASSSENQRGVLIDHAFHAFFNYDKIEPSDPNYAHVSNFSFFYAKCDRIDDLGWGCAWRSIQTCASTFNHFPPFNTLRQSFNCSKQEYAEPGYGQRYLKEIGINSQLVLYNREKGTAKTPTELCAKIDGFKKLRDKILDHFKTQNTPIMADDELYALTIVGIHIVGDKTILFIADPHKLDAVNGLYWVELDSVGNQIGTNGKDYDDKRNGLSTVKQVFFTKGWMLLFPQPNG